MGVSWASLKNCHFEVSSLILCNNNESFLNWILLCDKVYFIHQQTMSSSLLKAKLVPRKDHGDCLVVCCRFDPLQLSESWWNHYIWEVCSANWWNALKTVMPEASIGQQKGPNSSRWQHPTLNIAHPTLQKFDKLGYKVLPHSSYSADLLPTNYHLFKHLDNFLQGEHFHNQQKAENAVHEFIKSWSTDFHTTGINKLISHWQKCVDFNDSYFD